MFIGLVSVFSANRSSLDTDILKEQDGCKASTRFDFETGPKKCKSSMLGQPRYRQVMSWGCEHVTAVHFVVVVQVVGCLICGFAHFNRQLCIHWPSTIIAEHHHHGHLKTFVTVRNSWFFAWFPQGLFLKVTARSSRGSQSRNPGRISIPSQESDAPI